MMIMHGLLAGKKAVWVRAQMKTISRPLEWVNPNNFGIVLMLKLYPKEAKIFPPSLQQRLPRPLLPQPHLPQLNLQQTSQQQVNLVVLIT
jgi:hypothetical protein